jgi:DNA-binding Xre family transcriptional regulator
MAQFNKDKFEDFLGVVRKYMQVRGPMSQKDLSVKTRIGVSTMSRFMSMKTSDINPQIVAKICAYLDIPLHEVIDFVEEDYTESFIRLVKFYKAEANPESANTGRVEEVEPTATQPKPSKTETLEEALIDTLGSGTAQRNASAQVKMGHKQTTVAFSADQTSRNSETSLRDKLDQLTPRQKAYMSDFLSLDMEARDLIVDLGNDLFRYFRQKGMII